jgi:hypothetical protein
MPAVRYAASSTAFALRYELENEPFDGSACDHANASVRIRTPAAYCVDKSLVSTDVPVPDVNTPTSVGVVNVYCELTEVCAMLPTVKEYVVLGVSPVTRMVCSVVAVASVLVEPSDGVVPKCSDESTEASVLQAISAVVAVTELGWTFCGLVESACAGPPVVTAAIVAATATVMNPERREPFCFLWRCLPSSTLTPQWRCRVTDNDKTEKDYRRPLFVSSTTGGEI